MAWERRGKSLFFYWSRRTPGGEAVKEYVGRGERAAAAAAAVTRCKTRREADRQAVREEQARLAGPDALTDELVAMAESMMEATLLAGGFHRPNFGPWRRKRRGETERNRAAAGPQDPR